MPRNPSRTIVERGSLLSALAAGTRYPALMNAAPVSLGGNNAFSSFYLEPDDYIGTKLRMRLSTLSNDVASTSDYTVSLHQILTVTGGAAVVGFTVGPAIAGSTITITQPGANTALHTEGEEFSWPSVSGWFVFRIVNSVTGAASSSVQLLIQLEVR